MLFILYICLLCLPSNGSRGPFRRTLIRFHEPMSNGKFIRLKEALQDSQWKFNSRSIYLEEDINDNERETRIKDLILNLKD